MRGLPFSPIHMLSTISRLVNWPPLFPPQIDEGEEDDVIYKAEPVEQVTVEDADTDDETAAERAERDQRHQFDLVKVKVEPVDPG